MGYTSEASFLSCMQRQERKSRLGWAFSQPRFRHRMGHDIESVFDDRECGQMNQSQRKPALRSDETGGKANIRGRADDHNEGGFCYRLS